MKPKKLNNQIAGFVAGIFFPLLISYLIFRFGHLGGRSYFEFINTMVKFNLFGKLLSLSVLPNLLLFFPAIWSERLLTARGVLFATIIYGITTVILVFIS